MTDNDATRSPSESDLSATRRQALGQGELVCGARVGPYIIREKLGEGGFAIVYLAEQRDPVRRRVALKVIKPGMDSRQVSARFEAERQALAMMDHPNVAKVFDAGSTASGRPYFVMEHVPGVPITEHCDRQELDTDERLELFIQVCSAVQHAHQKGIVHRDIKPSNVLVATVGDEPRVKVIDFGVAKALHQKLTERTIFTEQGQLVGSPEYMSPEQAEMAAQDIDTRADIYSLGVLLYEMLTGTLPFDSRSLRRAGLAGIQRIIREEDPPRPSTRLSSQGEECRIIARKRRADRRTLVRELQGDLDWIVMKALEKDRTRRYDTANGLAQDIYRHLRNEPVLAGPPSTSYRMGKFVRRNRTAVVAGVAVAAALATGAIAATVGLVRAVRAEAQAQAEAQKAGTEKAIADAVNQFLNDDLLAAVAPSAEAGRGRDVLMRDVLDEAAKRIEEASAAGGRFENRPLVEAAIRRTMGETYRDLGEYPAAEAHLERAAAVRAAVLGEEHPETLAAVDALAILYWRQGRYGQAEALHRKNLELRTRVLGPDHLDTLDSMSGLASLYRDQGRFEEAQPLNVRTLEIRRRVLGEEHPQTLVALNNLGALYWSQGRYEEALPLWVRVLEIRKRILGEEHPQTLRSTDNLGVLYWSQARHEMAEPLWVQALEIRRRVLGEEHPQTVASMHKLATLYGDQGRYEEALRLFVQVLEARKRILGDEHPDTLDTMNRLGVLYGEQGRYEEARPLVRELLDIRMRRAGRAGASADDKNDCAWELLTCEPADLRDPEAALRLAVEANDLTSHEDPFYLDTLSLAYHLSGKTARAIENQKKALALVPPGESLLRRDIETSLSRYELALSAIGGSEH